VGLDNNECLYQYCVLVVVLTKMSYLRYRWPMFPQTINAMYQFYENEIGKINTTVIITRVKEHISNTDVNMCIR